MKFDAAIKKVAYLRISKKVDKCVVYVFSILSKVTVYLER